MRSKATQVLMRAKAMPHLSEVIIFLVLALILGIIWGTLSGKKQTTIVQVTSPAAYAKIFPPVALLITPTATPTATLTPTPVYTGYCINEPVLMYHHIMPWEIAKSKGQTSLTVDSNSFDEQMNYLSSHGFTTLYAEDLVNALHTRAALPARSVIVTIDDGYDDIYTYAFPILKKYHIKATLMVPTGLLGVASGSNTYFSWGQLSEMLGSGIISVGNHTWSHFPMGTKGMDKDIYEITTSQTQLQQNVQKNPIVFAYPYGTNATLSRVQQELTQYGFIGAFSTIGGTYQCDSFIMALRRVRIGNAPFPGYGIY